MECAIFIIILAVLKESHSLNPEILKYDQYMKDFEATGRRIKQEAKDEKVDGSVMKRESRSTVSSSGRRTFTFSWQAPTEPSIASEEEDGKNPASADMLIRHALTTTREVLDMQTKFLIGVIQQFFKIKHNHNITWTDKFQNILINCQSIIDYDLDDIKRRIVGNHLSIESMKANPQDPESIAYQLAYQPRDYTTNPLKTVSISTLIEYYNQMISILERDKTLKGVFDQEIQVIRRLLDNAEGELHRFNFRIRKVMKRVAKGLSTTLAVNSTLTVTTPMAE